MSKWNASALQMSKLQVTHASYVPRWRKTVSIDSDKPTDRAIRRMTHQTAIPVLQQACS